MTFLHSIILGIVEGFTEFLPISSTAHLILTSEILNLESSDFLKTFEISIQLGAIASVVFLYWKTLISRWELNKKILTAFIPTAIIGLILYKTVKDVFLENPFVPAYALLIGGIVIILFELWHKKHLEQSQQAEYKRVKCLEQSDQLEYITYRQALAIGLFQSIAIVPGVSRAAATILGGLAIGINRKTIVEFSFLLAIPTMAAATGLDLLKNASSFSGADFVNLSVGFIISFITAVLSIKFLLKFIQNHNFTNFGIYRIIIAIIFLLFVL